MGFRCGSDADGVGVHQVALLPVDPAEEGVRMDDIAVARGKFCLDGRDKRARPPLDALHIQDLHALGHQRGNAAVQE